MIDVDVPGFGRLALEHLVLDYNGTMAVDGKLVEGAAERLVALSERASVHVVTADTFGLARAQLGDLPLSLHVLPPGRQDVAKEVFVRELGAGSVAAFGNGRNDRLMLEAARLGIAVLQGEGAASAALVAADVVCPDIASALDLLAEPLRLVATLRS